MNGNAAAPRRRRLRRLLLGVVVFTGVLVVGVIVVVVRERLDQAIAPLDGPLPTTPPQPVGSVTYRETAIVQGGNSRQVGILVPADLAAGERLPVVVILHGRGSSPQEVTELGDWRTAVASRRFMAVLPRGQHESWNAGGCCRLATTFGVDDVRFLDVLIADMAARPEADPARVFLVGDSNGGMMAYRYACDHAERLAGLASVMGTDVSGCEPSAPLALMHVAATGDEVVPYEGGRSAASFAAASTSFPPVRETVADAALALGCTGDPTSTDDGLVVIDDYTGCPSPTRVQLVTIDGGTHLWPLGAPYDATTGMLDFFGI